MAIDLSHNTAPLSGVGKPSLEQISKLLKRTEAPSWRAPRPDESLALRKISIWYPLTMALGAILVMIAAWFCQPQIKPLNFTGAKNVYVVVKYPSTELKTKLLAAHEAGTVIRLATPFPPEDVPYTVTMVDAKNLSSEGILVDGLKWLPLK